MNLKDVVIRKFKIEDADAVSKIIINNLKEVNCKDYPESVIKYMCEMYTPKYLRSMSNMRKIYVAVDDDKIIGTASINGDNIDTVFIDTRYHGKGVGKKLMDLLEEIAAHTGIPSLRLQASITARDFYEKLGYEVIGEIESKEFGKSTIMEKFIL